MVTMTGVSGGGNQMERMFLIIPEWNSKSFHLIPRIKKSIEHCKLSCLSPISLNQFARLISKTAFQILVQSEKGIFYIICSGKRGNGASVLLPPGFRLIQSHIGIHLIAFPCQGKLDQCISVRLECLQRILDISWECHGEALLHSHVKFALPCSCNNRNHSFDIRRA